MRQHHRNTEALEQQRRLHQLAHHGALFQAVVHDRPRLEIGFLDGGHRLAVHHFQQPVAQIAVRDILGKHELVAHMLLRLGRADLIPFAGADAVALEHRAKAGDVDQHQLFDPRRVMGGKRRGDPAPDRIADQRRSGQIMRIEQRRNRLRLQGNAQIIAILGRFAETEHVDSEHPALGRQRSRDRRPVFLVAADTVHDDHRRALPRVSISQSLVAHGQRHTGHLRVSPMSPETCLCGDATLGSGRGLWLERLFS